MSRAAVSTEVLNKVCFQIWQIRATVECAKNNLFEVCERPDDPKEPQQVYLCLTGLLPQFQTLLDYINEEETRAIKSANIDNGIPDVGCGHDGSEGTVIPLDGYHRGAGDE